MRPRLFIDFYWMSLNQIATMALFLHVPCLCSPFLFLAPLLFLRGYSYRLQIYQGSFCCLSPSERSYVMNVESSPREAGAGSLFTCPRRIYCSPAEACGDTVTMSDFWMEPEAPNFLPPPLSISGQRNAAHWVKRCQTLSRLTLFHRCVSVVSLFSDCH